METGKEAWQEGRGESGDSSITHRPVHTLSFFLATQHTYSFRGVIGPSRPVLSPMRLETAAIRVTHALLVDIGWPGIPPVLAKRRLEERGEELASWESIRSGFVLLWRRDSKWDCEGGLLLDIYRTELQLSISSVAISMFVLSCPCCAPVPVLGTSNPAV